MLKIIKREEEHDLKILGDLCHLKAKLIFWTSERCGQAAVCKQCMNCSKTAHNCSLKIWQFQDMGEMGCLFLTDADSKEKIRSGELENRVCLNETESSAIGKALKHQNFKISVLKDELGPWKMRQKE